MQITTRQIFLYVIEDLCKESNALNDLKHLL